MGSDGGFAGLKQQKEKMIEYKVGNRIYATTDRNHGGFVGHAEITHVGRVFAEAVAENRGNSENQS